MQPRKEAPCIERRKISRAALLSAPPYCPVFPSSLSILITGMLAVTVLASDKRFGLDDIEQSTASFNLQYPLIFLGSCSSCLRLLPRLLVTSILPSIFASNVC